MKDINEVIDEAKVLFEEKKFFKVIQLLEPYAFDPSYASSRQQIYPIIAKAHYKNDNLKTASEYFKSLIKAFPENYRYYFYAGVCEMGLNHQSQAQSYFIQSLQINPSQSNCYLNLAASYRHSNELDKAEKCYRQLVQDQQYITKAYRNLSLCVTYSTPDHPDKVAITKLLERNTFNEDEISHLHFALGKIYRDCNEYEKAYEHYRLGNSFKNSTYTFEIDSYASKVDNIIKVFSEIEFSSQTENNAEHTPVFVLGIPRGGKTLVEKFLCTNGKIFALEEFACLDKLVYRATHYKPFETNSEFISLLKSSKIGASLNQFYFDKARERSITPYEYYCDTTPCNFRYVGYAKLMAPHIKLIHIVRNPLDHIFMIYCKYFATGNYWAFNLENIVNYYVEYRRLMDFWSEHLADTFLLVQYEDLIQNPAKMIDLLFGHVQIHHEEFTPEAIENLNLTTNEINYHQNCQSFLSDMEPFMNKLGPYL